MGKTARKETAQGGWEQPCLPVHGSHWLHFDWPVANIGKARQAITATGLLLPSTFVRWLLCRIVLYCAFVCCAVPCSAALCAMLQCAWLSGVSSPPQGVYALYWPSHSPSQWPQNVPHRGAAAVSQEDSSSCNHVRCMANYGCKVGLQQLAAA